MITIDPFPSYMSFFGQEVESVSPHRLKLD